MAGRFKDFDVVWSERTPAPVRAKVLGKLYDFPPTLSAKAVLKLTRAQEGRDPKEPIALDEMLDLLAPVLGGRKVVDELVDNGINVDQLNELLEWVVKTYTVASADRTAEEEGTASDPPAERTAAAISPSPSSSDGLP